nr:hypothetical protein [Tanacetum cinerariifolium]
MQQFWYTIKKVQGTNSYEFLLANKKCTVNAEVFRTILDICPRVEGTDFTNAPDDVTTLTFLIDLGYKGLLNKHTNIFMDHMHQPWRTLEAIINKCLSGKTASNDKLRKSKIDILWGMFKRENFDYPELIWEDLAYQIDHRKEKRSRRENMPCPRFTKIIINHFLKQHKSLTNINYKHYHTIKDDGIISRLKFVRIESEPEPKLAKKKTSSKRRVRKKAGGKSSKSVVIQDTLSAPKSKPTTSKTKLKGSPSLTPEEQEAAEIMQAPKERKKSGKRQPGTEGSHEGTDDDVDDVGGDHISDTQMLMMKMSKLNLIKMLSISDEEITDTAKADAKKTSEAKDDAKKTEFLPSSSSLSVSLGFGDQFLKLSSDSFLSPSMLSVHVSVIFKPTVPTLVHEYPSTTIATTLPPLSISTTPLVPQQTTIPIPTPTITTDAPTITTDVLKSNAITAVELRVAKLERDMFELKTVDHSNEALLFLSQVPSVVNNYLGSKGVVDTVKDHKRNHGDDEDDDDEDPLARPNHSKKTKRRRTKESESTKKPSSAKETPKSKASTKGSKISKSASAKEPVEEPIVEVVMDDAGDDVARNDNQPQDTLEPQTRKNLNPDWHKQHPRPPTPDPEWNKRQVVLDQPAQPWYMLNGLKIENLTQDILLGPAFNLLKGTCSSSIELEYNFQECFNALTDKLDLNNPEGDRYPFDLSKPLPLQGPQCHQIIVVDYFFNNDLEYLKTSYPYVTYTSSITKIKVARCKTKGIEDRVPTLWSTIKLAYDKDAEKGIKQWGERRIVYKDLNEHKRVLQADELYKFSNDTLKSVLDEIHHRVLDFRLDYNKELPKRKWTAVDRKRSGLMIELIDKQLGEREIIINLERLVGARELKMDYKLMTRTV